MEGQMTIKIKVAKSALEQARMVTAVVVAANAKGEWVATSALEIRARTMKMERMTMKPVRTTARRVKMERISTQKSRMIIGEARLIPIILMLKEILVIIHVGF
jgi:hypothetical protein